MLPESILMLLAWLCNLVSIPEVVEDYVNRLVTYTHKAKYLSYGNWKDQSMWHYMRPTGGYLIFNNISGMCDLYKHRVIDDCLIDP